MDCQHKNAEGTRSVCRECDSQILHCPDCFFDYCSCTSTLYPPKSVFRSLKKGMWVHVTLAAPLNGTIEGEIALVSKKKDQISFVSIGGWELCLGPSVCEAVVEIDPPIRVGDALWLDGEIVLVESVNPLWLSNQDDYLPYGPTWLVRGGRPNPSKKKVKNL